jgi:hypothetical protein
MAPVTANRYSVTARREGDWWVIDVDGVGVTQAKRLDKVEHMARDLVAAMNDVDSAKVRVDVRYELPVAAVDALAEAKEAADVARQLAKISADSTRNAATVLHGEGLSLRDIAHLLGVSFQRVHQILGEPLPAAALDSRHDAWDLALRAVREAEKADRDRAALRASLKHATKAEALASVHALEPARRQAAV